MFHVLFGSEYLVLCGDPYEIVQISDLNFSWVRIHKKVTASCCVPACQLETCSFFGVEKLKGFCYFPGQIITRSHDLTPKYSLVREIPLLKGNLGW